MIQTGTVVGDRTEDAAWQLNRGSGIRPFRKRVDFGVAFPAPPTVTVGLSHLDLGIGKILVDGEGVVNKMVIYHIEAIEVDSLGFTLSVTSNLNVEINRIEATYTAVSGIQKSIEGGEEVELRDVTVRQHLSCANFFIKKGSIFRLGLDPELVFVSINVWSGAIKLVVEEISSGVPGEQGLSAGEAFNFVGKCFGDPTDATTKRGYLNFQALTDVQGCLTVRNLDDGADGTVNLAQSID